ncbi:MAG: hypothetical protein EBS19_04435, partial [Spirochaetia bacterium]|nr:hypothetical protein [Spirochaetia bacterium]
FLNESAYNVGIPLYRGTSFQPERTIKRNKFIGELQDFLTQIANGTLSEISVVAEIPTQGKNAPQYLKDIYAEMGYDPSKQQEDKYDPETDVYVGDRSKTADEPSRNIFVDSEFIVKDVDQTRGVIIAVPYSLKRKNVIVELTPDMIDEAYVK